jgi:hypothetical protein
MVPPHSVQLDKKIYHLGHFDPAYLLDRQGQSCKVHAEFRREMARDGG